MDVMLDNARDWCGYGYHVSIIIDTYDRNIDGNRLKQYEQSVACTLSKVQIEVIYHENARPDVPYAHLMLHRQHFLKHINHFDIFVYSDDDISIRASTLQRWLYEMNTIDKTLWGQYFIGLLYYENSAVMLRNKQVKKKQLAMRPELLFLDPVTGKTRLRNRVTWSLTPGDVYLVSSKNSSSHWTQGIPDGRFITTDVPTYSASYILHKSQLQQLEMKCNFLAGHDNPETFAEILEGQQIGYCQAEGRFVGDKPSRNLNDPHFNCCMRWLMPVEPTSFQSLLIQHIGTPGLSAENK